MAANNLVSVIVPVYNVEDYLVKCVESIKSQTYTNLEIILVDDGATDSSGDICDSFAAGDSRVKVIHKVNGGLSDARNKGLDIAAGDYIAFVDSDDFIDGDMIDTMLNRAIETGSEVVECNLHHTFTGSEDTEIMPQYFDTSTLICLGRYIVWNKLYKADVIKRANARFPFGLVYEDVEFSIKLFPHINGYAYVDIAPYHYVQRSNSLNNFSTLKTMHILTVLSNIVEYYREYGFFEQYREALEFMFARVLLCSSLYRMSGIRSRPDRKLALRENWNCLKNTFPNWKKNGILRSQKTRHAKFMRTVGPSTYKLYCALIPKYLSLKRTFSNKMN